MHHGSDQQLGADEGELTFRIGLRDGKVVLDFGKPVRWIGMSPQQAEGLADDLHERAKVAKFMERAKR